MDTPAPALSLPSVERPLLGETVLITGASGGIGRAVAMRLVAEGGTPLLHYGRDEAGARALHERLGGAGFVIGADLMDPDGATRLWAMAEERAGRITGLVNNAGVRAEVRVEDDLDAWHEVWRSQLQVNLLAAADLCRAAIAHYRRHGGGRIVAIGSRAGQRGYMAEAMPYGAAKAALANMMKSIARSFGHEGVTAVTIAPGWVRTAMADDYVAQHGATAVTGEIPTGAMAETMEVAELACLALRPSLRSLNGATLDVNGGSYVR